MPKTFTATQLANISREDAFNLHADHSKAIVTFGNGYAPAEGPFEVTLSPKGVGIVVVSEHYGRVEILSPTFNNGYAHNISHVAFIN